MSWNVIHHKTRTVESSFNDLQLQSLERLFMVATKKISKIAKLNGAGRGLLFVEICYAMIRHRAWLQTPVFSAFVIDFLQSDYGLPYADACSLTHEIIDSVMAIGVSQSRSICIDDREFLTWVYVCVATSTVKDDLECDIGLGSGVLHKLSQGIQTLDQISQNAFIPEYDALLAAIVIELQHECKHLPYAMDYHRLRFAMLAAVGDDAQEFIFEEVLPTVMNFIVEIGFQKCSSSPINARMVDVLIRSDLISVAPNGKSKKILYELTDLGAKISAHKVAVDHFSEGLDRRFEVLNERWQLAAIRFGGPLANGELEGILLDRVNHLSPHTIEAIVAKISRQNDGHLDPRLVDQALKNAAMGWHKSAILRALQTCRPNQDLLEIATRELANKATPGVQLAANSLVDAWKN